MATKKRKLISAITAVAVSAAILLGGTCLLYTSPSPRDTR